MDYVALKAELDTDPLTRGYAGMTDEQVVTDLNTENRTRIKDSLTGAEIYSVTDGTEFAALTDAAKAQWLALCAIESIDPNNGTPAAALTTDLFGGGSTTQGALVALREETVSRAVEIGLGNVIIGDVQNARAL